MITSAPLELSIGGSVYEFYPLTFEDFEWLELKLRARYIEAGRLGGVDIDVILEKAQDIDIFNELDSLTSPIVLAWAIQRMLRRSKKAVSAETVQSWIINPVTQAELMPHLTSLCGLGTAKNEPQARTPTT